MSDAWMMNADQDAAVGTAVIEADDETFTITAHGLENYERVIVTNLTGGAVGVLADGGTYWVRDITADTFKVALIRGGLPVEFGVDGGADVDRYQPAFDAREIRRIFSGLLWPHVNDQLGARQGLLPAQEPAVSLSGSDWTLHDNVFVVYPGITVTSGPYITFVLEAFGSLDAADATNDRFDALDLLIEDDDEDNSGFRRSRVVPVTGSPGSGEPAVTPNALRIVTFLVGSGGTPAPAIDSFGTMTVARGGIMPFHPGQQPAAASLPPGAASWDIANRLLQVVDGGEWDTVGSTKGYQFWQRLYYSASDAFDPADYPGAKGAAIHCIGGGGAGGGAATTGASQGSCGGGGQAGASAWSFHTWDEILAEAGGGTIAVTVGAGGTGVSGANGNDGNPSSFGSLVSAGGGVAGSATAASGTAASLSGATSNQTKVGQVTADGAGGGYCLRAAGGPSATVGGHGGSSLIGGGARGVGQNVVSNANGPGGGGSGAANRDNLSAKAGGDGFSGRVIVDLYV